jgi:hypothetical protein
MGKNTLRQYYPITTSESSANDGLSIRAINDLADSINNWLAYGQGPIICDSFISADGVGVTSQVNDPNDTDEHVVLQFAPRFVFRGAKFLYVHGSTLQTDGSAGNSIFRVYSMDGPAQIDSTAALDRDALGVNYNIAELASSTTSWESTVVTTLTPVVTPSNETYIMVTCQNGSAADIMCLSSLQVWPV